MCGIVGAVAKRNIVPILVEGLRRLEYRGYDSAGVAVVGEDGSLSLSRTVGKVAELEQKLAENPLTGKIGVAHTRWATHGGVTEANAHPHLSGGRVAVIHNGIIENFQPIKDEMLAKGYAFNSETDTEVAAHLVHDYLKQGFDLVEAVGKAVQRFEGAYALLVIDAEDPDRIVVSRVASPLVIGVGDGENFVASGVPALLPVTQRFIYLEQGDLAEIRCDGVRIVDTDGNAVTREVHEAEWDSASAEKAPYKHFMLKEIHDQPSALADTLYGRVANQRVIPESLGPQATEMLKQVENIHIVACGTSYHAGCVGKYWIEALAGVPTQVEIASEYRYRHVVVPARTLFVTLSQSGETADTLEALRMAKQLGYLGTLTICNSPHSSMVRESDLVMMTQAGPEIGVASTKAFTTQLLSVLVVTLMMAKHRGLTEEREREFVANLTHAAAASDLALKMSDQLKELAHDFADKQHTLFLGRGPMWPIAMEGALKLKEIS
ncbi:MAG: glutamine--fructose-6-phosphate transaminase (isomerizing), partial [Gammaproteobacteria bacterium]|nr:glutamine--fructose-6-phosphate transaminase (isomerizing) [Gammaproteobacteria bacterium]